MERQDFENGGHIEFDKDMAVACAVTSAKGVDVVLKGDKDNIFKGLIEGTVALLRQVKSAERFAFLAVLRERIYEEDLMAEKTEWKLTTDGIEIPVRFSDALRELMKLVEEEQKKDR